MKWWLLVCMTGSLLALAPVPSMAGLTTGMVQAADMIVVGRCVTVSTTGTSNARIGVEELLKGHLAKGKTLILVYRAHEVIDPKARFILFLRRFQVDAANVTKEQAMEKYEYVQFLGDHLYGLEDATEPNLAQVKQLVLDAAKKSQ